MRNLLLEEGIVFVEMKPKKSFQRTKNRGLSRLARILAHKFKPHNKVLYFTTFNLTFIYNSRSKIWKSFQL